MSGLQLDGSLAFPATTISTLVSGVFTQSTLFHKVAAETGTTDDLTSITPDTTTTYNGAMIILMADTGDTITIHHNEAAAPYPIIFANGKDLAVSGNMRIPLWFNGTNWGDACWFVAAAEITDELTTITFTAPTPDYAIQALTQTTPFGFVTADEGHTVLSVIANLQARVNALETVLVNLGILADAD